MVHADKLRSVCGEVFLRPLKSSDRWSRALRGVMRRQALSLALYYDRPMVEWVHRTLRHNRVDGIFAFSGQMGPYALPHLARRKSVMDFVDVDSEKWRQYAEESSGLRQIFYGREAQLLRDFEKYAARRFDASLFVSEQEAKVFRRIAGNDATTVGALGNGVDYGYFDPAADFEWIDRKSPLTVVFTGAMDYRPNIDAVAWFAEEVWPQVRAARSDALFQIVGSKPAGEVLKLGGRDGIEVTGRVPDVRPYLANADVAVAPLRIARGIQNKVLEAMAMARPVVATGAAFEGINAVPGEHLVVENDPAPMARAILDIAGNEMLARSLGQAARRQVIAHYDWRTNLAILDDLFGLAPTGVELRVAGA